MARQLFSRYVQRTGFMLLTSLLLGSIGLQIFIPQMTRTFIDAAPRPDAPLVQLGLLFLGVALIQQLVTVSAAYMSEKIAWNATNALRLDLAQHCLNLDMEFHHQHPPGTLIERLDSDVIELANFFSQLFIRVGGNLLLMMGIVGVLFVEDWRLGVAFGAFSIASLALLYQFRNIAIPHEKHLRETEANLFGFLEERLSGIDDIRANGSANFVVNRLFSYQAQILQRWRKAGLMQTLIHVIAGLVMTTGYGLAFLLGYSLFQAGAITLGTVYLLMTYANLLNRPFTEITFQVESLQKIGASLDRVTELLQTTSRIQNQGTDSLPQTALTVRFEQVTFGYTPEKTVLHDLSFEVAARQVIGVVGRTGSGKTTLTRLLLRLYESNGIWLNGLNIQEIDLENLRQRVGLVTQDVQLFEGTLRDNLSLFDTTLADALLIESIERLGLADWYAGLAQGLDTPIAAHGKNLSAGEAQLLAFVRVFLRDPSLVLLDEATSRLDPKTQQYLESAIDHLLHQRTAIIIAHRLETLQRADYILMLENGHLVEWGARQALAANPQSHFYHLLKTGAEEVLV